MKIRLVLLLILVGLLAVPVVAIRDDVSSMSVPDGEFVLLGSHEANVWEAQWSHDGTRVATASRDGKAIIWDVANQTELFVFNIDEDLEVYGVVWSHDDSKILTRTNSSSAQLWDTTTGERLLEVTFPGNAWDAVFSADSSQFMLNTAGNQVLVYETASGRKLLTLDHTGSVNEARWNRDETQIMTGGFDDQAHVWDAQTGNKLFSMEHDDIVWTAVWNQAETAILTSSSDGSVRLWNADTGERIDMLSPFDAVNGAFWIRDESIYLLWANARFGCEGNCNYAIYLINTEGLNTEMTMNHDGRIRFVHPSKDATRLLSSSYDNTARIWNADPTSSSYGKELLRMEHPDWIYDAVWSPDETLVVTAAVDGGVRVWGVAGVME